MLGDAAFMNKRKECTVLLYAGKRTKRNTKAACSVTCRLSMVSNFCFNDVRNGMTHGAVSYTGHFVYSNSPSDMRFPPHLRERLSV